MSVDGQVRKQDGTLQPVNMSEWKGDEFVETGETIE